MMTGAKYEVIHTATCRDNNLLSISVMCELAHVSRSGYYAWLEAEPYRKKCEDADRADFELVLAAYKHRGYAKGARSIHMRLLHENVRMNLK